MENVSNEPNTTSPESKMSSTHAQLVKTNGIAIENNALLIKKLKDAQDKVATLEETVDIQLSTIPNLSTKLDEVESRFIETQDKLAPEYVEKVNEKA